MPTYNCNTEVRSQTLTKGHLNSNNHQNKQLITKNTCQSAYYESKLQAKLKPHIISITMITTQNTPTPRCYKPKLRILRYKASFNIYGNKDKGIKGRTPKPNNYNINLHVIINKNYLIDHNREKLNHILPQR